MRIEVLYFGGCPNYAATLERLKAVLREDAVDADVSEIEVADGAAARRLRFIGSPTVRINGLDIEADARTAAGVGFACRRYSGGAPSEATIRAALKEAREQ